MSFIIEFKKCINNILPLNWEQQMDFLLLIKGDNGWKKKKN